MTGEGIHTFESDVVAVRDQGSLLRWIGDRGLREGEVHRPVVVQDQEAVLPPDHRVLHRVLDTFAPRQHDGELCVRVGGVRVAELRRNG